MGLFDSIGERVRDRWQNLQAHPLQNIASTVLGGFVPGGGIAANALFNRYNDNQFNNSANAFQNLTRDQSNLDTNDALNKPLNGPLGEYDRNNPYGDQSGSTGDRASQDRQLGQALTGGGGGQNAGGPMGGAGYQPIGGWNQGTMSGWNPNQANGSQAFGLLDFLGQNPNTPFNLPTTPSANGPGPNGPVGPSGRRDGMGFGGNPMMGVSNFMVGGSPVINGVNPGFGGDMNGLAMYNPRRYGG